MVRKIIIIDNLKISYLQGDNMDKSKALVFLHGWMSEAVHLESIFKNLENYLAIDLPGFGQSETPHSDWNVDGYADFLKNFLDKLGISNPILIGHSLGGSIIIKYLAKGGVARKAVLIASSGLRGKSAKKTIYKILALFLKNILYFALPAKIREKMRKKIYYAIGSDYYGVGGMKGTYLKIIGEDLRNDMKKIRTKTVLVWGESDNSTPLEQGEEMKRLISDSELHVIKSAGHFPFLDRPREFNEIFLQSLNFD